MKIRVRQIYQKHVQPPRWYSISVDGVFVDSRLTKRRAMCAARELAPPGQVVRYQRSPCLR